MNARVTNKAARELLKALRPEGFAVVSIAPGTRHWKLTYKRVGGVAQVTAPMPQGSYLSPRAVKNFIADCRRNLPETPRT